VGELIGSRRSHFAGARVHITKAKVPALVDELGNLLDDVELEELGPGQAGACAHGTLV
jgi:hypothetical protein